jgi:hypothetical protein
VLAAVAAMLTLGTFTPSVRLNLQVIRVDRSPVQSSFGYNVGGHSGTTISAASSILF